MRARIAGRYSQEAPATTAETVLGGLPGFEHRLIAIALLPDYTNRGVSPEYQGV